MKATYYILSAALGATALFSSCSGDSKDYDASGIFETTEVIVSAKAAGEIEQLNIEEGQEVTVNSQLGYIDTLQLHLKKMQLYSSRKATGNRIMDKGLQLATIRQQIAIQERERARYEKLVKSDAATQKQLDDINYQIQVLQRQLAAQSEQLSNSNSSLASETTGIAAQIAQINDQIHNSLISTPITGTILAKYVEQGEYATPGKALFKVSNIGDMKLRVYVTSDQLTSLLRGRRPPRSGSNR
jgi:HlyD family secretion protein